MRIFIAIPLPRDVERELLLIQHRLPDADALRLASGFHCTLRFLGELDNPQLEAVQKLLSGIRFSPFALTLTEIGTFPNWNAPNVLWVGTAPSKDLEMLQYAVTNRLKGIGNPENHAFHPHLTLARVQGTLSEDQVTQIRDIIVKQLPFAVNHFILYESIPGREGMEYREIATYG